MAVFTTISDQEVDTLLRDYELGDRLSLEAISEGIENTNYRLQVRYQSDRTDDYVLTIFENVVAEDLPYFCQLTIHLANKGFAVPGPVLDRKGNSVFHLQGKPGVIVPLFPGKSSASPSTEACTLVGTWIAEMHLALADFPLRRPTVRNEDWLRTQAESVSPHLDLDRANLLKQCIEGVRAKQVLFESCQQGVVHGDLFHDNVLFDNGGISGVIDFYHACDDCLLYDLAVTANDWARDSEGRAMPAHMENLVAGYQLIRPWSEAEKQAWPYLMELAALRFWLSRLRTQFLGGYQQESVSGDTVKDPEVMRRILLNAQQGR